MMEKNKLERLAYYKRIRKALNHFQNDEIEKGIMSYCLSEYGVDSSFYKTDKTEEIIKILKQYDLSCDLETVIELFESFLDKENKDENGIVFTPKYISDYIVKNVLSEGVSSGIKVIDPSCGCGIFLVSIAEQILAQTNLTIDEIIENFLFGIDIDKDNTRRCTLTLRLLCAKYGGDFLAVKPNIFCGDSLKCSWSEVFGVESFSFIVGNPPYVNPHDMDKKTALFLKENFKTTQAGTFNIFYAFIEQATKYVCDNGVIGFIVPNNFLYIKAAYELRAFIQERKLLRKIIDFGDNMVFRPVRTYNSIIFLTSKMNENFEYAVLPYVDDIKKELETIKFSSMPINKLDKNGWKLVNKITRNNIDKIESQMTAIKSFIRTGIATLKDDVYLIDKDSSGYFKEIEGTRYCIEGELVRPIYKIPDLRRAKNIEEAKRYIIFPYERIDANSGYTLMSESILKKQFPMAYKYLCSMRTKLDSRDKGKGAAPAWYAYGRTQGLNTYGKKLLFPTFASKPKFIMDTNEDALFCNGYAVFENDLYDLDLLQKVLNSSIMDYYVRNTSYAIEGGYYCYQKKYIENFSLPLFTKEDISFLYQADTSEVDKYLCNLYGIQID